MNPFSKFGAPVTRDRGFALVGVVMFVLVLTILGLSLFSLASYESQFLTMSDKSAESFYAASDGLDRARFILAATSSKQAVQVNLPDGTILYAKAKQGNGPNFMAIDSTTSDQIIWNGAPVWIRALAIKRGQRTLLEARYTPIDPNDYYRRLLTLSGNLTVIDTAPLPSDPTTPVHRQTNLSGEIWRNGTISGTFGGLATYRTPGGVMQPDVSTYFSQHSSAPVTLPSPPTPPTARHWELDTQGNQYAFFRTPAGGAPYSVTSRATLPADDPITVHVSGGIAIWMLDRGMRADDIVTISGGPGSALVIVAGKTTDTGPSNAERGFNLLGGLNSTIPLILVTDGIVGIEHKEQTLLEPSNMLYTSIYARDAYFMGPNPPLANPTYAQNIFFPPSALNPVLDLLESLGLLPNTNVANGRQVKPIAGTWRDISESDAS